MECRVNKPYPKIEVVGENAYYASLLLEDYAGISGEETAIHQYIFQHFDQFKENVALSKTLEQIAMVEMHHLELLGETIKQLGVTPKMVTNHPLLSYWSSSFVNYEVSPIPMLISDIKIEKEAIKNYQKHISLIDDPYIKNLLYRIIEDEEVHIQCFQHLLEQEQK